MEEYDINRQEGKGKMYIGTVSVYYNIYNMRHYSRNEIF
jgi:hypothetical protein